MITNQLNPDIRKLTIGKKELRTITILPLSLKDQFEMSELISTIIIEVSTTKGSSEEDQNSAFVLSLFNTIKNNIELFLGMVTDSDSAYIPEFMTNNQLIELSKMIYEMNYENLLKNVKDLILKAKSSQAWMGSSPKSSPEQPIELTISTEEVSEKVD